MAEQTNRVDSGKKSSLQPLFFAFLECATSLYRGKFALSTSYLPVIYQAAGQLNSGQHPGPFASLFSSLLWYARTTKLEQLSIFEEIMHCW
jgi:hypothetical protein